MFDHSKIDVEDFLSELGIQSKKRGNQHWFSCPLPSHIGNDHTPSISMEEKTTRTYCFGCKFAGNAVSFLSEFEGISPLKAKHWIRERFNVGSFENQEEDFKEAFIKKLERMDNKEEKTTRQQKNYITIPEAELDKRLIDWDEVDRVWSGKMNDKAYPFAYMLDRGFQAQTLNEWAFGWDMISQRICFPIRDEKGSLVGFKGRTTDPNERSRYLILGGPEYGFDTFNVSQTLFGLHKVGMQHDLIVCEGEFNTIAMHQFGYTNTVGISGKHISERQVDLIKEYCSSVMFIFDDYRDTLDAVKQLEDFISVEIFPKHDKDPADMNADEVHSLMSRRSNGLYAIIEEAEV